MKYYKLIKDLPTFDAGDRFVLKNDGCLYLAAGAGLSRHWRDEVMAYHRKTLERFPNILEGWFKPTPAERPWEPKSTIPTNCGLLVAGEDYYEIDEDGEKTVEFSWNEAMEIEKKTNGKWRLPTIFEWNKLLEEFGSKDNTIDRDAFVERLGLTENKHGYGYYWPASPNPSDTHRAYVLSFNSSRVFQDDYDRYYSLSVRLVRDLEEKK